MQTQSRADEHSSSGTVADVSECQIKSQDFVIEINIIRYSYLYSIYVRSFQTTCSSMKEW